MLGWLSGIYSKISSTLTVSGSVNVGNTVPVTGTFWQTTQPVSASSLPLPSGAAQESGNLATLAGAVTAGKVQTNITNTSIPVTGTFWQTTQPVSGTVTANAGTNLNTSALALETGGNLATLAGTVSSGKMQVSASSLPLPSGAAQESGNLATISAAQGTSGTGISQPTGGSGLLGWLSGIYNKLSNALTVNIASGQTVGIAAGTNAIGSVSAGGFTAISTTSVTRSANTTAYTIGQVVSGGSYLTFSNVVRANGSTGVLASVLMTDSSAQSTKPLFSLWLFSAAPTSTVTDAATWNPVTGDLANLVCPPIQLYGQAYGSATGTAYAVNLNLPFKAGSSSTSLYGVLVANNAYTPTSSEVFGVSLGILED